MARAYQRNLEALRLSPNAAEAAERLRSLCIKASPANPAALLTIDQSCDLPALTSNALRERYIDLETADDASGAGRIALLELLANEALEVRAAAASSLAPFGDEAAMRYQQTRPQ